MLRVGGLIPDDEFSAETHTCTKFSIVNYIYVNICNKVINVCIYVYNHTVKL